MKRIIDYNPDIHGLVFCRTRKETQEIAEKLIKEDYSAEPLHGDMSQAAREGVMQKFRDKSIQILIATDVAARGIDVRDITHVINYKLPDEARITFTEAAEPQGQANQEHPLLLLIQGKAENFRKLKEMRG